MALSHSDRALIYRILVNQEDALGLVQDLSNKVDLLSTHVDAVSAKADIITMKEDIMAADLSVLQAAVAHNTDVDASAVMLLNGLKASLDAAIAALPDPAALDALSAQLGTDADALAAAVVANTPMAPPAPPGP